MRKKHLLNLQGDRFYSLIGPGVIVALYIPSQWCRGLVRFSLSSRESMKLLILVALFGLGFAQHNPQTKSGRTAIVHLFEWRWADIAAECERFLGPKGFGGVQVHRAENRHILVVKKKHHSFFLHLVKISCL